MTKRTAPSCQGKRSATMAVASAQFSRSPPAWVQPRTDSKPGGGSPGTSEPRRSFTVVAAQGMTEVPPMPSSVAVTGMPRASRPAMRSAARSQTSWASAPMDEEVSKRKTTSRAPQAAQPSGMGGRADSPLMRN
jgi:hypothetical protein